MKQKRVFVMCGVSDFLSNKTRYLLGLKKEFVFFKNFWYN